MPFDAIRRFVETKAFESTLALQVFFTARESAMIHVVRLGFFNLLAHSPVQQGHQLFTRACFAPLVVVPEDGRVRREVFRVSPPSYSRSPTDRASPQLDPDSSN